MDEKKVIEYIEGATPELRDALIHISIGNTEHVSVAALELLRDKETLGIIYRTQLLAGGKKRRPGRPRGSKSKPKTEPTPTQGETA